MKILLIGADQNNPTDGVIVAGIRNLLFEAYGEHTEKYVFLQDHVEQDEEDIQKNIKFDKLVVCGTPWLWDQCFFTQKYKNLKKFLDSHQEAHVIFFGIGSCFPLNQVPHFDIDYLNVFFDRSNHTIFTRDSAIQRVFNLAEIKSLLLPCPAFYAISESTNNKQDSIIWYNPKMGISSVTVDSKFYQNWISQFMEFNDNHPEAEVYCAQPHEQDIKIFRKDPKLLSGWKETLDVVLKSRHVLSGRVHCAVPAYRAGCDVTLAPVDSRHKVLEDWRDADFELHKETYLKILRGLT